MIVNAYLKHNFYRLSFPVIAFSYLTVGPPVLSQISSDGTLSTQITPNNNQLVITGGVQAGNNLFHSFNEFSVPYNQEALFNNSLNIHNIITRVTGNSLSDIQGVIRANGLANLILINPNGIIFGPNAQIDIGGSFLATTANSLKFADGSQCSATHTQNTPLLTMSAPVGLQFGTNPGAIVNQAQKLGVKPGNTFALVGGDVSFRGGNLTVEQGRVELGSVGGNNSVQLTLTNPGFQLGYSGVQNFQDISLSQGASVQANNSNIQLQGRQITLTQGQISSQTVTSQAAGDITINASEGLEIIGNTKPELSDGQIAAAVREGGTGRGGNILINTKQLIVQDGGFISASTDGQGSGGIHK